MILTCPRLQIDVEWLKGIEEEAVYPVQGHTLAQVLTQEASRVLFITCVSVHKKVSDFAFDMKMSFPDKIVVKVSSPLYLSFRTLTTFVLTARIGFTLYYQKTLRSSQKRQFRYP